MRTEVDQQDQKETKKEWNLETQWTAHMEVVMNSSGGMTSKISMEIDIMLCKVDDHKKLTKSYFRSVLMRNHL